MVEWKQAHIHVDEPVKIMKIPFPYDLIGYWMNKHKVELSSKAYRELARLFITYGNYEGKERDSNNDKGGAESSD